MDTKDLHWSAINPPRLLWIKGSLNPYKAEGHHKPSHVDPLKNYARRREKAAYLTDAQLISRWLGNYGKEACGFPDGHLMKQTRGRCPHILALANTRTALRAWREDSGDITRILLTTMIGLLAQRGARKSDTITLCTRILLAAQDLHNKRADHGGAGGTRGTRESRWKQSMAELLSYSCQSRLGIL